MNVFENFFYTLNICQKLMSANYQISMSKIMTFAPLGPFFALYERAPKLSNIFKSYIFFSIFLRHIEPTCQKNMS